MPRPAGSTQYCPLKGRRDIPHNDTQHNDSQPKGLICDTQLKFHSAQRHSAQKGLFVSLTTNDIQHNNTPYGVPLC